MKYKIRASQGVGVPVTVLEDGMAYVKHPDAEKYTFPIVGTYDEGEIYAPEEWKLIEEMSNTGQKQKVYHIL